MEWSDLAIKDIVKMNPFDYNTENDEIKNETKRLNRNNKMDEIVERIKIINDMSFEEYNQMINRLLEKAYIQKAKEISKKRNDKITKLLLNE